MNNYKAYVRLGSGHQWVQVQANNLNHAKQLLNMLYGAGMYSNLCQGTI